jgi:hypothetical protein
MMSKLRNFIAGPGSRLRQAGIVLIGIFVFGAIGSDKRIRAITAANASEYIAPTDCRGILVNNGAPEIAIVPDTGLRNEEIVVIKFMPERVKFAGRQIDASGKYVATFGGKSDPLRGTASELNGAFHNSATASTFVHNRENNSSIIHDDSPIQFLGGPSNFPQEQLGAMRRVKFPPRKDYLGNANGNGANCCDAKHTGKYGKDERVKRNWIIPGSLPYRREALPKGFGYLALVGIGVGAVLGLIGCGIAVLVARWWLR